MLHTLHILLERDGTKRAEYLRKNNVFKKFGKGCMVEIRVIPLYPELIAIGDNVKLASGVHFVTHDVTHSMINNTFENKNEKINEKLGCIEIGSNVFVGGYTTILSDVKIGDNVIIGAGSVVVNDIPSNSVAVGVPARVINSYDKYLEARINEKTYPGEMAPKAQEISRELADWCWNQFYQRRGN